MGFEGPRGVFDTHSGFLICECSIPNILHIPITIGFKHILLNIDTFSTFHRPQLVFLAEVAAIGFSAGGHLVGALGGFFGREGCPPSWTYGFPSSSIGDPRFVPG